MGYSNASFDDEPHVAQLHGFAGQLAPPLRAVNLAHVLAGDTCTPIGLSELEAYLSFIEHSLENLQFIVWYQSYRTRFFDLPKDAQALSPGLKEGQFTCEKPAPARTELRHQASLALVREMTNENSPPSTVPPSPVSGPLPGLPEDGTLRAPASHPLMVSSPTATEFSDVRRPSVVSAATGDTATPAPRATAQMQPFRDECARIVATFFTPGASKELSLEANVRDTVVRNLTWNTHPDVFLPAYEEAYHTLETVSLPRFLLYSSAVTNRPKQLFWYLFGLTDLILGLGVFLALALAVPTPPQANRAWRLFAVPLAVLGPMKIYTGWRGFCLSIYGRGAVQLRPWEMQEMDAETGKYWERVVEEGMAQPPADGASGRASPAQSEPVTVDEKGDTDAAAYARAAREAGRRKEAMLRELATIAPFADTGSDADHEGDGDSVVKAPAPRTPSPDYSLAPRSEAGARSAVSAATTVAATHVPLQPMRNNEGMPANAEEMRERRRASRNGYRRPPVFGPEKVVLEPRIREVHRKINLEIHLVGLVAAVVFTALFLAVPSRA